NPTGRQNRNCVYWRKGDTTQTEPCQVVCFESHTELINSPFVILLHERRPEPDGARLSQGPPHPVFWQRENIMNPKQHPDRLISPRTVENFKRAHAKQILMPGNTVIYLN